MRYVPVGCATVCGMAFAALTVAVVEDSGPLPGDRRVLLELHDAVGDSLDDPLVWLANLTDLVPLAVAAALVAVGLAWRRQWRALAAGSIVVGVVWALNPVLKDLIERGRPDLWPHPMTVSEYSFPSGHAANTAAFAAALAMIAWSSRLRTAIVVAGVVVVVLVAFGQLALGLHYPSDILAGWLWAGAWAALVWSVLPPPWSIRPPPAPSGPPPTR